MKNEVRIIYLDVPFINMPTSGTKIALPVVAFILLVLVIGATIGYLFKTQNNSVDSDTKQESTIKCNICGNPMHPSKFFEDVFTKYLERTEKSLKEREYGGRCNGISNEHDGIDCGKDGLCWTIDFSPQHSPALVCSRM